MRLESAERWAGSPGALDGQTYNNNKGIIIKEAGENLSL